MPAVLACAALGRQAHHERRRFQPERVQHAADVLLMPDLGELAVSDAEDLLAGHDHRPPGRRQAEELEGTRVGGGHGPAPGHVVAIGDHHVGLERGVGEGRADHLGHPYVPGPARWLSRQAVVVHEIVGDQLLGHGIVARAPFFEQPAPVHRLQRSASTGSPLTACRKRRQPARPGSEYTHNVSISSRRAGSRQPRVKELTSTSYAVLGLLAAGPRTTYELVKQVAAGCGSSGHGPRGVSTTSPGCWRRMAWRWPGRSTPAAARAPCTPSRRGGGARCGTGSPSRKPARSWSTDAAEGQFRRLRHQG